MMRYIIRPFQAFLLLLIMATSSSCMESLEHDIELIKPSKSRGLFIANEGNFMFGNASLSYYDIDSMRVENSVFFRVNGAKLGDVAQSVAIYGQYAFVVVNNSGVVYIIDKDTFEYVDKITGLASPRYIHFINSEKAYITDLYAFAITVFNPTTFEVYKRISTKVPGTNQHPTEQMVQYKNFVFTNCWSYDSKLLVIDTNTDKVVDSVEVGNQPTSLVMDKNNKLWTVTDGGYAGSPTGQSAPGLYKIDAETRKVEKAYMFKFGDYPSEVCLNGARDTLYFINKDIWCLDVDNEIFPEKPFYEFKGTKFYGLGVDPITSEVYVADAVDYQQHGVVYRFRADATPVDTFRVGIIPGDFCFKN